MKTKVLITICICITIILVGLLFWPTLYRYDKMTNEGITYPLKINRLTGRTSWYAVGLGWLSNDNNQNEIHEKLLPPSEAVKVEGKGFLGSDFDLNAKGYSGNFFWYELYNGSNWILYKAFVTIRIKENDGKIRWERKFVATPEHGPISPLNNGKLRCAVTDTDNRGAWEWLSTELWGAKAQ